MAKGAEDGLPGVADMAVQIVLLRRAVARLERAKAAIRANFHVKNRQTAAVRWSGYGITL